MIYLAVDVGTTNTRVWLLEKTRILEHIQRPLGVHNAAISGDSSLLRCTLRDTIRSLLKRTPSQPRFVLAAGMITSAQGLYEVPHVVAPAGKEDLSQKVRMRTFAEICACPFFLIPGVRTKPAPSQLESIEQTDIIRGEESEIVGLQIRKKLSVPWLFFHLGSHTKAIQVDEHGHIVRSISTLAGECFDALRTQTILSEHLKKLTRAKLSEKFLLCGSQHANHSGLLRTLFMVRLLGENGRYSQSELYSFLLGALIASDFQAIEWSQILGRHPVQILISGHPNLQRAWSLFLKSKNCRLITVDRHEREAALLGGLRAIAFSSPVFVKDIGVVRTG